MSVHDVAQHLGHVLDVAAHVQHVLTEIHYSAVQSSLFCLVAGEMCWLVQALVQIYVKPALDGIWLGFDDRQYQGEAVQDTGLQVQPNDKCVDLVQQMLAVHCHDACNCSAMMSEQCHFLGQELAAVQKCQSLAEAWVPGDHIHAADELREMSSEVVQSALSPFLHVYFFQGSGVHSVFQQQHVADDHH